jgi:hypothetical protein
MNVTLVVAVLSLVVWVGLLLALPPSGWIHVPLAVGATLLVRWIALTESVNGKR